MKQSVCMSVGLAPSQFANSLNISDDYFLRKAFGLVARNQIWRMFFFIKFIRHDVVMDWRNKKGDKVEYDEKLEEQELKLSFKFWYKISF